MHSLDVVCFEAVFQFDLAAMRRFATDRGAIVRVAETGGELAGFVIFELAGRRGAVTAYVVTLDVNPRYRRMGLAGQLMREAEADAQAQGAQWVWLHVFTGNVEAQAFYEGSGYRHTGRVDGFYGEAMNAEVYRKQLTMLVP